MSVQSSARKSSTSAYPGPSARRPQVSRMRAAWASPVRPRAGRLPITEFVPAAVTPGQISMGGGGQNWVGGGEGLRTWPAGQCEGKRSRLKAAHRSVTILRHLAQPL
jgi:hypothetical protein